MSARLITVLSMVAVLSMSIWGQVFASAAPGAQAGPRAAAAEMAKGGFGDGVR
jgi:hypothetical protein